MRGAGNNRPSTAQRTTLSLRGGLMEQIGMC
jgi:hypothetical protein